MMKILYPFSILYQLVMSFRTLLYKLKILRTQSFDIPIISIGNITLGGTGKTPMAIWLFNYLQSKKKKPCIITRGYGRKSNELIVVDNNSINYRADEIGDEPLMMLKNNKNIKIVIYNDKIKAIEHAIDMLDIDIIILDDGFQSLYIKKDLDVIMINAKAPTSEYNLLPVGRGRESIKSLTRADVIIANYGDINTKIADFCASNHIKIYPADCHVQPVDENKKIIVARDDLRCLAICGIAGPSSFLSTVKEYKMNIHAKLVFPDHHRYTSNDMNHIYELMETKNCNTIITTWKDYYKINPLNIKNKKIIILDMKLNINNQYFLSMINDIITHET